MEEELLDTPKPQQSSQPVALTHYDPYQLERFVNMYEPTPFDRDSIDFDRHRLRMFFGAHLPPGQGSIDPMCDTLDPLTPYIEELHRRGYYESTQNPQPTICVKERIIAPIAPIAPITPYNKKAL